MDGFLRILLAEESEVDSFVIQCELSKLNLAFTFKRAADRKEYLQQLDEFSPTLLLADNNFDGLDLIAKAREKYPKLPIIVILSAIDEHMVETLISKGASDCIFRSQLQQLTRCVERTLKEAKRPEGRPAVPFCRLGAAPARKSIFCGVFGNARTEQKAEDNMKVEARLKQSTGFEAVHGEQPVKNRGAFANRFARFKKARAPERVATIQERGSRQTESALSPQTMTVATEAKRMISVHTDRGTEQVILDEIGRGEVDGKIDQLRTDLTGLANTLAETAYAFSRTQLRDALTNLEIGLAQSIEEARKISYELTRPAANVMALTTETEAVG